MRRKGSQMGSSKYEFEPDLFNKDIQKNKERYDNKILSIQKVVLCQIEEDPSRMNETFSMFIEVLKGMKREYGL